MHQRPDYCLRGEAFIVVELYRSPEQLSIHLDERRSIALLCQIIFGVKKLESEKLGMQVLQYLQDASSLLEPRKAVIARGNLEERFTVEAGRQQLQINLCQL